MKVMNLLSLTCVVGLMGAGMEKSWGHGATYGDQSKKYADLVGGTLSYLDARKKCRQVLASFLKKQKYAKLKPGIHVHEMASAKGWRNNHKRYTCAATSDTDGDNWCCAGGHIYDGGQGICVFGKGCKE